MVKKELYKMFFKRYIFWVLLFFVVIKCCISTLGLHQSTFLELQQEEKYESYMQYLSGELTDEKENFILSEKEKYIQSSARIEQLTNDYAKGKVSDIEYENSIGKETIYIVNQPVFQSILKQYNYIKVDPTHRYFLEYSGWNALLNNESIDFVLLLFLLTSITVIFNYEFESGMSVINLTCKFGRKKLANQKIFIGMLLSFVSVFLFTIVDVISILIQGELPYGNYPIQSSPIFANFSGNLSFIELLCVSVLLKIIGCCYASSIIMCVSVISKSTLTTLFINLGINTIPFILQISPIVKLLLPLPGGLLTGTGHFAEYSIVENNEKISVSVQMWQLGFLIVIIIVFMIILNALTLFFYEPKRKKVIRCNHSGGFA